MRKKRRRERSWSELERLLWDDSYWWFVTPDERGRDFLAVLVQQPEVQLVDPRPLGVQMCGLSPAIPSVWTLALRKALLPPQVMSRVLDRLGIAYTRLWLEGVAPVLVLCQHVSRFQACLKAVSARLPHTDLEWTGEQPGVG